uniref:Glycine-rich domain-containing protein n=1 Tax=viral metagenome TaxID=1070528 RepID=A0A6C0I9C2_9ZZZZ
MSGLNFRPGKKGGLRKALNKLFYCQTRIIPTPEPKFPFTGSGFTYTFSENMYTIVFKNNGNITFTNDCIIEYIIAGGGGGGGAAGTNPGGGGGAGGGGGGGEVINSFQNITNNQLINIVIGNGGTGGVSNTSNGQNGQQTAIISALFTIAANGGLGGGRGINADGGNGGNSGSGGLGGNGSQTPNIPATSGTNGGGGGGGGYFQLSGKNGAINNQVSVSLYGAGGGGGAGNNFNAFVANGLGGNIYAGNGGNQNIGASATSNYGGGGGGGGIFSFVNYSGGNGGSGLVIIYLFVPSNPNPSLDPNHNCIPCDGIGCIQEKASQIKSGNIEPIQTQSARITQLATQRLGGRTIFGDIGLGLRTNNTYLGGIEGQPGGSPRPLRNKF